MYTVRSSTAKDTRILRYIPLFVAANLLVMMFISYYILSYENKLQDVDFERQVFLLFLPVTASVGFFVATTLCAFVKKTRINIRIIIISTLIVLIMHYPAGVLGSIVTSSVDLKYPEQELYANMLMESISLCVANGIGSLILMFYLRRHGWAAPRMMDT